MFITLHKPDGKRFRVGPFDIIAIEEYQSGAIVFVDGTGHHVTETIDEVEALRERKEFGGAPVQPPEAETAAEAEAKAEALTASLTPAPAKPKRIRKPAAQP